MRSLKKIFQLLRVLLICPGINWSDDYFRKDLARWQEVLHIEVSKCRAFAQLMWDYPEFRTLFIYRNRFRKIYRYWIALCYRPMPTLYIQAKEVGGGLFIQHGFSTMISAESIGENCWINQQVTIGFKGAGRAPIIEDNVIVTCGAKVLGSITVGAGAVIGANAVVVHDVDPGAVMGGIPAKRIK